MYCNKCGSGKHFAANCDAVVHEKVSSFFSEPKVRVAKPEARSTDGRDTFCSACGTNLSARDRERARRREWMKRKRHAQD